MEIVLLGLIPFGTTGTAGSPWTHVSCRNLPHPRHGPTCPRLTLNLTRFFFFSRSPYVFCCAGLESASASFTHFHKISVELFLSRFICALRAPSALFLFPGAPSLVAPALLGLFRVSLPSVTRSPVTNLVTEANFRCIRFSK